MEEERGEATMTQNGQISEAQTVLDLRMEYPALMTAYAAVSGMFWTGYTAFFAVNTLLATALGLSYSAGGGYAGSRFIKLAHMMIPAIGMFIAVAAVYAAHLIVRHQNLIISRGMQIDGTLATRSFTQLMHQKGFPVATAFGSALFFVTWAGILYFGWWVDRGT
jgi:hypothetical protein